MPWESLILLHLVLVLQLSGTEWDQGLVAAPSSSREGWMARLRDVLQ